MKVKVCGITDKNQMISLPETGADFAGFIFYQDSPRYVLNHLIHDDIRNFSEISKVGVFVNASPEEVIYTSKSCRLDFVQLHGEESPDDCRKIAMEVPVIKAFRIATEEDVIKTVEYEDGVSLFLFDTKANVYGGTGKKFTWSLMDHYKSSKPWMLSGGINASDTDAILEWIATTNRKNLFALDINSCFETKPGIKDLELVKKFISTIKKSFIS